MNENILSNNLNRIKTATNSIREIVAMPTEDITDVAVAVEGISSDLDEANSTIDTLNEDLETANSTIADLNEQNTELENEVNTLNEDLETANSTIAELEQEIEEITPVGEIEITENGSINVAHYEYANVNVGISPNIWQRPTDWWDTETILTEAPRRNATTGEEDENGLYPAYIVLLDDSNKTTTFKKATRNRALQYDGILTSDGSWYTVDDALHTWDESKDKSCSEGYKTRYFIVYFDSKNKSSAVSLGQFPCLEVIVGDIVVPNNSMLFGGSTANTKIEHYEELENTIHTAISSSNTFSRCYSLKSVSLPSLTTISAGSTFYNCPSLTSVSLPSLTSIGNNAVYTFAYCSSLTSVSLPSLTTISATASSTFSSCSSLTSISLPSLTSIDASYTFQHCYALTSISLPSLTNINNYAINTFDNCYSLTSVSLPSLTTISATASNTFSNCSSLISILLPSLTTISAGSTFYNCPSLTSVSLPSLTSISGDSIFGSCASLTSVSLPSLVSIGSDGIFSSCFSLTRFELPSTIAVMPNSFGSYLKALILPNDFELDLNLTGETSLTHSALLNIIDKLKDFSVEGGTHTLTLGTTNLAKLSSDEIAIATDKGWTAQ